MEPERTLGDSTFTQLSVDQSPAQSLAPWTLMACELPLSMVQSSARASEAGGSNAYVGKLFSLAIAFATLGVLTFDIDLFVSSAFLGEAGPVWGEARRGIQKLCRPMEAFGNGMGAALLIVVLVYVRGLQRNQTLWISAVVLVSGLMANVGKVCIPRVRPLHLFDHELGEFAGNVSSTFSGWAAREGHAMESFPSGHTAVAVSLSICLAMRWPRARLVFSALAILAAMQRISFGHHYPSDCLFAASIACIVTAIAHSLGMRLAKTELVPDEDVTTVSLETALQLGRNHAA